MRKLEDDTSSNTDVAEGDTIIKYGVDDDLTSLTWLQDKNLLKDIHLNSPVVPPDSAEIAMKAQIKDERIHHESDIEESVCSEICPNMNLSTNSCPNLKHPFNVPYDPLIHVSSKPPFSFSCLIFMAIESSPHKALPVKDIYNWILEHFPYYKNAPNGWKNSVRHNLSLNKCFQKVEKTQNVGKGSLWTVESHFRPNLLHALRKAPYTFSRALKSSSNDDTDSRIKSDDDEYDPIDDQLNDVDAATAMMVLKHGPNVKLDSDMFCSKSFCGNKSNINKVENCESDDSDMNYRNAEEELHIKTEEEVLDIKTEDPLYTYTDADDAYAADEESNSSIIDSKDEEQRKIEEGADALLNLAGIHTSSNPNTIRHSNYNINKPYARLTRSTLNIEEENFKPRFIRRNTIVTKNKAIKRKSVNMNNNNDILNNNKIDNHKISEGTKERVGKKRKARVENNFFGKGTR